MAARPSRPAEPPTAIKLPELSPFLADRLGDAQGFVGATVIAIIGAIVVRIILKAIETRG